METTFETTTPNARVHLTSRASQQISSLSGEEYLQYEDALVELSVRMAMGDVPEAPDGEHMLEYAGCTLLYQASDTDGSVLVRRVYCSPFAVPSSSSLGSVSAAA